MNRRGTQKGKKMKKINVGQVVVQKLTNEEVDEAFLTATEHPQLFDAIISVVEELRERKITEGKLAALGNDAQAALGACNQVLALDLVIEEIAARRQEALHPDEEDKGES